MTKYLTLLLLSFMMFGCSSKSMSVSTVTQEFWRAQQQDRIDAAKQLTVKEDIKKTTLYKKIRIKSADFGKAKEDGNSVTVPTKLYLKDDKNIGAVDFTTKLNKTDHGWRVNMTDTKRSLYIAISKQVAGNFGNIFKDSLGEVDSIKTIFGEFIKNFKDVIENSQK